MQNGAKYKRFLQFFSCSVLPPRPIMPGTVYIGGAHIKPPKPLPNDLQKYLDESKHGVIYFSFGTYVQVADMPKEKMKIFLSKHIAVVKFKGNLLNVILRYFRCTWKTKTTCFMEI